MVGLWQSKGTLHLLLPAYPVLAPSLRLHLPCPSQAASRWMAEAQALGPPKQQVASNERVRVDAGGPFSSWSRGGGGMVASQAQLHLLP